MAHSGRILDFRKDLGYDSTMRTISDTLLEAILSSGLSDQQLGIEADVNRLIIGRFKRGGHLRSDTIDALCKTLGLELRPTKTRKRLERKG